MKLNIFSEFALSSIAFAFLGADLLFSQEKLEPYVNEREVQEQFVVMQLVNALSNPAFQHELELVEDQIEKLKEVRQEYLDKLKDLNDKYKREAATSINGKTGGEFEPSTQILELKRDKEIQELVRNLVEKMNGILLPQQIKRLEQIGRHQQLKFAERGDEFAVILAVVKKLGLSKDQLKEFEKGLDDAKKRLLDDTRKAREKFQERLLDSLPIEARRQFEEKVGDIYFGR